MLQPSTITAAIVTALRGIPALVVAMGGDATRITAYDDAIPGNTNLREAILAMKSPSVLVVWQGTMPGRRGIAEVWAHEFMLVLRAGDIAAGYAALVKTILSGTVTASGLRFLYHQVHASCYPMDFRGAERETLVLDMNGSTLDYWTVRFSITEIGDN